MPDYRLIEGDCVESMRAMGEASVDAIVCDPPYGLEFMGKEWDRLGATVETAQEGADVSHPFRDGSSRVRYGESAASMQTWHEAWAREALRVLKPGGHLLAFGGTRTYHRLACAVEDAGFEVRDCLCWHYGSGFPKSLDVSKAIDKAAGVAPLDLGASPNWRESKRDREKAGSMEVRGENAGRLTAPATPDAERWQGWGTALKPAWEPIIVARKPLAGTVSANVLAHGTGALNVGGCRIAHNEACRMLPDQHGDEPGDFFRQGGRHGETLELKPEGRWPANVVLSHAEGCVCVGERRVPSNAPARYATDAEAALYGAGLGKREPGDERPGYADGDGLETVPEWRCEPGCPVAELDRQSGQLTSGSRAEGVRSGMGYMGADGDGGPAIVGDSGGASRFFYTAKASSAERNAGLAGFEAQTVGGQLGQADGTRMGRSADEGANVRVTVARNTHPTVKPIELMRWLVRLVTPPGGTILDPFAGSGTTGCAAVLEGFEFIGCEREADYVKIAEARIAWWAEHPEGVEIADGARAEVQRAKVADGGQSSIFDMLD